MLLEKKKKKKKSRINHDECPYSKDTQNGHNTEIQSNQPSSRSPTTCMNPQRKSPSVQPSVAAIMIAPKQKTAEPNDTAEPETSVRKVSILWTSYHPPFHWPCHAIQAHRRLLHTWLQASTWMSRLFWFIQDIFSRNSRKKSNISNQETRWPACCPS